MTHDAIIICGNSVMILTVIMIYLQENYGFDEGDHVLLSLPPSLHPSLSLSLSLSLHVLLFEGY
jgi:hypothetical protein